ncbi:MAG: hypothetical protein H7Y22_07570 [Gemmatimonadaceae bacterium]|nr:hypothetical protein [Gloeobacterales cyanobacterium ES-bin-141]
MGQHLFVKLEYGIVPKSVFDQYVPAHVAYVRNLQSEGRRVESGYWFERGGGMMIFEAASRAEAQIIVENDPLVLNGCVRYELKEWCLVNPKSEQPDMHGTRYAASQEQSS